MDSRSSTSSSERPGREALGRSLIAGGLAVVLVLAFDTLFMACSPWWEIGQRISQRQIGERALAINLGKLQAVRGIDERTVLGVILGSSRADEGLRPEWVHEDQQAGIHFANLAHPGQMTLQLHALVSPVTDLRPKLVILALGELELRYPLTFRPTPVVARAGTIALALREGGLSLLRERPLEIARWGLGALLHSYRLRGLVLAAKYDSPLRFSLPRRLGGAPAPFFITVLPKGRDVPRALARNVVPNWPEDKQRGIAAQLRQLVNLVDLEDAGVQRAAIRAAVDELVEAGARVLLVEAPLHPDTAPFRKPAHAREFRQFARELSASPEVAFLPLESIGRFRGRDFKDLTHLGQAGAQRFTRAAILAGAAHLGR